MTGDPISASVMTSLSAAIRLAQFILSVSAVSEEMKTFARLVQRVNEDREEALRERRKVLRLLLEMPEKMKWIDSALFQTRYALDSIGNLVRDVHISNGSASSKTEPVTLKTRFEWVLANKEEILTKQTYLSVCHASCLCALTFLHCLSDSRSVRWPNIHHAEEMTPEVMDEGDVLRSPASRRPKHRVSYLLPDNLPTFIPLRFEDLLAPYVEPEHDTMHMLDHVSCEGRWSKDEETVPSSAAEAVKVLDEYGAAIEDIAITLHQPRLEARRRRREAFFASSDESHSVEDDVGRVEELCTEGPSTEFVLLQTTTPVARPSTARRRRHIEAHFAQ